jgi:hypothetical protein
MYDTLIEHIVESKDNIIKIDAAKLDLKPKTLYYGLKNHLKGTTYEAILQLHFR